MSRLDVPGQIRTLGVTVASLTLCTLDSVRRITGRGRSALGGHKASPGALVTVGSTNTVDEL